MHRILLATDGSAGADRALDVAAEIAKAVGGELFGITVAEGLSKEQARQLASAEKDIWDSVDSRSRQVLADARQRARRLGVSMAGTHMAWGDPAQVIIEAIGRQSIDTLVLGRRGRGQLTGLLLGSVSQKVVALAPCIVIVVP